jgi:hypothetical protein
METLLKNQFLNQMDMVVGFGINKKGACFRSGTPDSYDHFFNDYQDAERFVEETNLSGYGDTLYPICPVKLSDVVMAWTRDDFDDEEDFCNEDLTSYVLNCQDYINDIYNLDIDTSDIYECVIEAL